MLFGFGKKKKLRKDQTSSDVEEQSSDVNKKIDDAVSPEKAGGLFSRLRHGLGKTRQQMTDGLSSLFLGKKKIDDEVLEELETRLLMADVGVEATDEIIGHLTERLKRNQLGDIDALLEALQQEMQELLEPCSSPLQIPKQDTPYVILMVGINGAGKTTTTGKLAKLFKQQGASVMLAAGDTFRAAAVEQLQVWGERNQIQVVAQATGADAASVVYDAMQSAQAKGVDVMIADTAGRLHTQTNLMEELKKVKRVMQKVNPSAPHEVMLVLDGSIGQNALQQARHFHEAIGVTGLTLTKLDGTAKGGVLCALAKELGLPVRFIGVGEKIEDLRVFDAKEFSQALLGFSEDE